MSQRIPICNISYCNFSPLHEIITGKPLILTLHYECFSPHVPIRLLLMRAANSYNSSQEFSANRIRRLLNMRRCCIIQSVNSLNLHCISYFVMFTAFFLIVFVFLQHGSPQNALSVCQLFSRGGPEVRLIKQHTGSLLLGLCNLSRNYTWHKTWRVHSSSKLSLFELREPVSS